MEWERLIAWFSACEVADDTFTGLVVAAHAYAAAVTMYEEARPLRQPAAVGNAGSLRDALAGLVRAEGRRERYEALVAVLVACQADLADPDRRAGMPGRTALDPGSGLTGEVRHAWKGRAAWRGVLHRRQEGRTPGPTSYSLRPDDQLDHLWFAWARGAPLTYAPLSGRRVASRVMTALGDGLDGGTLLPLPRSSSPGLR